MSTTTFTPQNTMGKKIKLSLLSLANVLLIAMVIFLIQPDKSNNPTAAIQRLAAAPQQPGCEYTSDCVPAAVVASSEQPVLISLVQYNAYVNLDGSVAVTWETGVELNQVGYNVYRSSQPGGSYDKINSELILAEGGYTGNTYQLTDNTASPFGYTYYTLEEINSDGKAIRHGPMAICVNCTPQP